MLNLSEAAKVSGQPKSAIWRAVNSGRLPAARTFAGDYRIDPAELHRVFPPGAELATDVSPIVSLTRDPTELERAEAASMQEQIERLFEVGRQIRKELDDAATPSTPPLAPATKMWLPVSTTTGSQDHMLRSSAILWRVTSDPREGHPPLAVVPNVHRLVGCRQLLRWGPGLQGFPGCLKLGLGRVEVLG